MTVNRGLDGPLFLCPDVHAMNNIIHIILNALTFGLLNRIRRAEQNNNTLQASLIELTSQHQTLIETMKHIRELNDRRFTRLNEEHDNAVKDAVEEYTDSWAFKSLIDDRISDNIEGNLKDLIKTLDLVRSKDLPDWDDFVKRESHQDDLVTVENLNDTLSCELDKDWFKDLVRDIVRNDCDIPDRDDVRNLIEEKISDENLVTETKAEEIANDLINTHEELHHPEEETQEDEAAPEKDPEDMNTGKALNDLMKPVVLSGKMVSVPLQAEQLPGIPEVLMTLTDADEVALVMLFRAFKNSKEDEADLWNEAINEYIDGEDERREMVETLIRFSAEYSSRISLWLEEDAHTDRKDGDQQTATYSSALAFGYDEACMAMLRVIDLLKRHELHADFISDRIDNGFDNE